MEPVDAEPELDPAAELVEAAPACLIPGLDTLEPKPHAQLITIPGHYALNTTDFPFCEMFESMLDCTSLSHLSERADVPFVQTRKACPHAEGTPEYQRHVQREAMRYFVLKKQRGGKSDVRQQVLDSPRYSEFVSLYLRFVRQEILPLFEEVGGEFAVQREPTIRVHRPGGTVLTTRSGECKGDVVGMHRDIDLGHQPNEVTFVVPITDMFGTNSVWAESGSGLADFAPFTMAYGYFHRWHSAQSRHYNMLNKTGVTRISFDFRVIPMSCFAENFNEKFQIGRYFISMKHLE